jgi:predicted transcriptional regulator/predicted  nucleic acid-binding Zn-ribbon protein
MVKKLSDTKVSKIFQLYFLGYSQTEIANKLKITQASVSIHVSQFKYLVGQQGIMAAAEECGVMDEVQVLYGLAVDLKKAKSTVEEAKTGLKVATVLQECGVEEEEYGDLIKTCEKIKNEGYLFAAVELSQLEDSTGMSYKDIVSEYKSTSKQLTQAKKELQDIHGEINSSNKELDNINKQKQLAKQDLKAHMDKVGLDMHRLEMVEALALALKEAGVHNQALLAYIQRQQLLNKAGIGIDLFATIIAKVNVITSQDHGKKLFSLLSEYGNLCDANKALQLQNESLAKQTAGLEQQAKLKGEIQGEIANLKAEKASLEPQVANLHTQKDELKLIQNQHIQIYHEVKTLTSYKEGLEQKINQMETHRESLEKEIELRELKVSDLNEVESKRAAILKEIAELQAKFEHDQRRWDTYQGFLGLVKSTSKDELQKSARMLPDIIESLPENLSVKDIDFLKDYVLQDLTGKKLPFLLKCNTCGASIATDKPEPASGYQCTNRGPFLESPHEVIVQKNPLAMLKEVLSPEAPEQIVIVKSIIPVTRLKKSDGNL